jgi:hypothetical protein
VKELEDLCSYELPKLNRIQSVAEKVERHRSVFLEISEHKKLKSFVEQAKADETVWFPQ